MRPRFLPRILIGKQALVQLLDKTKEGLSVAGLTSARNESYLGLRASLCAFRAFTMSGTSARTSRKVVPVPPWKELCFRFRNLNTFSGVSWRKTVQLTRPVAMDA